MADVFLFLHQYIDAVSLLLLSSIGLVIIFGMMGVINMAHGELMMIGAFTSAYSFHAGVPLFIAIVLGGVAAAMAGIILERIVIRRFYGRLLASLVATWGVSLAASQGALVLFGPSIQGLPMVFGSVQFEGYSFSLYPLALFAVALVVTGTVWLALMRTQFGVSARATMENPEMAKALGVNVEWVYVITFATGAFLAGIAGGLFALSAPVEPTFGKPFTVMAFIVVVIAGTSNPIAGVAAAVVFLALLKTIFTTEFNILMGQVGMLASALLLIWLAPQGISDVISRSITALVRTKK